MDIWENITFFAITFTDTIAMTTGTEVDVTTAGTKEEIIVPQRSMDPLDIMNFFIDLVNFYILDLQKISSF
mgnify:CR=1 FL=1